MILNIFDPLGASPARPRPQLEALTVRMLWLFQSTRCPFPSRRTTQLSLSCESQPRIWRLLPLPAPLDRGDRPPNWVRFAKMDCPRIIILNHSAAETAVATAVVVRRPRYWSCIVWMKAETKCSLGNLCRFYEGSDPASPVQSAGRYGRCGRDGPASRWCGL